MVRFGTMSGQGRPSPIGCVSFSRPREKTRRFGAQLYACRFPRARSLLRFTGSGIFHDRYVLAEGGGQVDLMILFVYENPPNLFRHGELA